jgi:hypothetical protein
VKQTLIQRFLRSSRESIAHTRGFDVTNLQYEIVKNLEGGIEALTNRTANYFLWEHFTTKPYVDGGIFRRVHSNTTPWPCFVMAVRDEILEDQGDDIKQIIKVINKQLKLFKEPLENNDLIELFSERYQQKTEDIKEWLAITQWNRKKTISKKLINTIQNKLGQFNVIENEVQANHLIKKVF